jgi:hypothetical protein
MQLILNRVKYQIDIESETPSIYVSCDKMMPFAMQLQYFKKKHEIRLNEIEQWGERNNISDQDYIRYSFQNSNSEDLLRLDFSEEFKKDYTIWLLGEHFKSNELLIQHKPTGLSLSAYKLIESKDNQWNTYERWDFDINPYFKEITFNIGSQQSFVSKEEIDIEERFEKVSVVDQSRDIHKTTSAEKKRGKVIANRVITQEFNLTRAFSPPSYKQRYQQLLQFYNDHMKTCENPSFTVTGFDSRKASKVSFQHNRMLFKNEEVDINPITGMRNHGVYKEAPNALDTQFLFIYENNDDANTLYKYLKNGYKGFPGIQSYVGIPMALANSADGTGYKKLAYDNLETLMKQYQEFEEQELSAEYYNNLLT